MILADEIFIQSFTLERYSIHRDLEGGYDFHLLKGKIPVNIFRFIRADYKAASIHLVSKSYLIYKTGFQDSEIYLKKKYSKNQGFEIIYNWRLNQVPFELKGRSFFLKAVDFSGKNYEWMENNKWPIMHYTIESENSVVVDCTDRIEGEDLQLLLLSGFFMITSFSVKRR